MKLVALVPPRQDGTVRVTLPGGPALVFAPTAEDDLACEVDAAVASALLATGNFRVAEEASSSSAPVGRRKGAVRVSAAPAGAAQEHGGGDLE